MESHTSTFQSTLSMRRATSTVRISLTHGEFQSTLSMRRATSMHFTVVGANIISIHALHEESDHV